MRRRRPPPRSSTRTADTVSVITAASAAQGWSRLGPRSAPRRSIARRSGPDSRARRPVSSGRTDRTGRAAAPRPGANKLHRPRAVVSRRPERRGARGTASDRHRGRGRSYLPRPPVVASGAIPLRRVRVPGARHRAGPGSRDPLRRALIRAPSLDRAHPRNTTAPRTAPLRPVHSPSSASAKPATGTSLNVPALRRRDPGGARPRPLARPSRANGCRRARAVVVLPR